MQLRLLIQEVYIDFIMEKTIFYEKQHNGLTRLLLTLSIAIVVMLVLFGSWIIKINYNGNPFELDSITTYNLVVMAVLILILSTVVIIHHSFSNLITKINDKGLTVTYFSIRKKQLKIEVKEILSYKLRKYNPYREYWGYGVRENWMRGKAYIINGRKGLHIQLKNGKCVLIGTQKEQAIEYAMRKLMGRENSNKNG